MKTEQYLFFISGAFMHGKRIYSTSAEYTQLTKTRDRRLYCVTTDKTLLQI
jgi:hypothetical protein